MLEFLSNFFDQKKYFLSTVRVSSYLPGRIRCYSTLIHHNEENAKLLEEYFSAFKEITNFSVNVLTGSVLIEYDVEKTILNDELHQIEQALKEKAPK